MLHLYKYQLFFPFALKEGSFNTIKQTTASPAWKGQHFIKSPPISIDNPASFAEYVYFHPHARNLLFDTGQSNPSLVTFEVKESDIAHWKLRIQLPKRDGEPGAVTCDLNLDWVIAMIYDLDVGVLSIGVSWDTLKPPHPESSGQSSLTIDDVIDINNLLRRSSPSFLSFFDIDQCEKNDKAAPPNGWAAAQKGSRELPLCISLIDDQGNEVNGSKEDFGADFDSMFTNHKDRYIARHYRYWLDRLADDLKIDKNSLKQIMDERNLFCSFVIVDPEDSQYNDRYPELQKPAPRYQAENKFGNLTYESEEFRKFLYRLVFADPAAKLGYVANRDLRDRLLSDSLYLRYKEWGTYYGFTRYSGVYLCHTDNGSDWFPRNILSRHFDAMYFQIANLLLMMRAVLLEFSHRSTRIAQQIDNPSALENPDIRKLIEDLRADFLRFHNKYWFCEVTSQEQGVEIFDLWNRNLENRRLFDEVSQEIQALHEFGQAMINDRLSKLTYLNVSMVGLGVLSLGIAALGTSAGLFSSQPSFFFLCFMAVIMFVSGAWFAFRLFNNATDIIRKLGDRESFTHKLKNIWRVIRSDQKSDQYH